MQDPIFDDSALLFTDGSMMIRAASTLTILALGLVIGGCLPAAVLGQSEPESASELSAMRFQDVVRFQDEDEEPLVINSGVGYIDSAIPANVVRFRFDSSYNNVQPARVESFWPIGAPLGPGPGPETRVDYQDFSAYLEIGSGRKYSLFGELPIRLLNPVLNDNANGLSDVNVGAKYAVVSCPDTMLTLQFRTYIPSGDEGRGLGTGHVSLEPAVLFYRQFSSGFVLEGEIRDWISVGGTPGVAGNVLRYGLGGSYLLYEDCSCRRVTGVAEFVGWTVLDGSTAITTNPPLITQLEDAAGATIVNAKLGLRWSLSPCLDVYTGYGRALTDNAWYDDTLRIELRRSF